MRILLFANTDWYLYNFRFSLAQTLRDNGDDVVLVSPPGQYGILLKNAGFRWIPIQLNRRSLNPIAELASIVRLAILYKRERPDLVHHFTIKCVIYGSLAAKVNGIYAIVNALPGFGHVFSSDSWGASILRQALSFLFRLSMGNSRVIFQHSEDRVRFQALNVVTPERLHVIRGSGVDTNKFSQALVRNGSANVSILLASRLLWAKGVGEFVEAARLIKNAYPKSRFIVAGDLDQGNPDAIPAEAIALWREENVAEFLGHRDDIADILKTVDIVVLPTYYGEGVPRILVEAAASGLPLVATGMAGCLEIVIDGENGLIVPARDAVALASAINRLIEDANLRAVMGKRGREIAIQYFSEEKVISETLGVYRMTLSAASE